MASIDDVKKVCGVPATNIKEALRAIIGICKEGESVVIQGFGTFSIKDAPPRVGRNPKTGDVIQIPAKKKLHFKQSATLKL